LLETFKLPPSLSDVQVDEDDEEEVDDARSTRRR